MKLHGQDPKHTVEVAWAVTRHKYKCDLWIYTTSLTQPIVTLYAAPELAAEFLSKWTDLSSATARAVHDLIMCGMDPDSLRHGLWAPPDSPTGD